MTEEEMARIHLEVELQVNPLADLTEKKKMRKIEINILTAGKAEKPWIKMFFPAELREQMEADFLIPDSAPWGESGMMKVEYPSNNLPRPTAKIYGELAMLEAVNGQEIQINIVPVSKERMKEIKASFKSELN